MSYGNIFKNNNNFVCLLFSVTVTPTYATQLINATVFRIKTNFYNIVVSVSKAPPHHLIDIHTNSGQAVDWTDMKIKNRLNQITNKEIIDEREDKKKKEKETCTQFLYKK